LHSHKRGAYLFAGNRKEDKVISRVQAWRVLRTAVNTVGIVGKISLYQSALEIIEKIAKSSFPYGDFFVMFLLRIALF